LGITALETDTSFKTEHLENQVKKRTPNSRIVFRLTANYEFDQEFAEVLADLKTSFVDGVI